MRVKGITGASKATGVTCPITVEGRPSLETLDFLVVDTLETAKKLQ